MTEGIPSALPALALAAKLQRKAAPSGMVRPDEAGVRPKSPTRRPTRARVAGGTVGRRRAGRLPWRPSPGGGRDLLFAVVGWPAAWGSTPRRAAGAAAEFRGQRIAARWRSAAAGTSDRRRPVGRSAATLATWPSEGARCPGPSQVAGGSVFTPATGATPHSEHHRTVIGREVLDSRGNPTVEVEVAPRLGRRRAGHRAVGRVDRAPTRRSSCATVATARGQGRPGGRGPRQRGDRRGALGLDALDQRAVDLALIDPDGTPNKSRLGANAILGVSLAVARAAAEEVGLPLYRYVGGRRRPRAAGPDDERGQRRACTPTTRSTCRSS